MAPFRRVLVATDLSETSQGALKLAIELARTLGSELTVLHTCEIPAYSYTPELAMAPVDLLSPVVDAARVRLTELMRQVHESCPGARSLLEVGVPAERILSAASAAGADLIVVGTHGRRGVAHALLGSVAEKVVRSSPVPVLAVRPSVA
jgi:nucleotide-binding universal stress UspA family protein